MSPYLIMDIGNLEKMIAEKEGLQTIAFPALMRKVYVWMTLALVITGIAAYGVASSPRLITALFMNKGIVWGLLIAELAMVIGISAAVNRLSLTVATLLFVAYAIMNGVTFSAIFVVYATTTIGTVFLITAGTFAVMAAYGHHTRKDLSSAGRLLLMALVGLIIATVVNLMLLGSSTFDLILSYAGVIVFVGLTAWDSQKIRILLAEQESENESAQKIALLGALTLYLDFINLFLWLLRILDNRS